MPNELELNPTYHVPEERAELFTADTVGSTEHEYLALLVSLVMVLKPKRVLETGAETGVGTQALMAGIKANGFGQLISIEMNPESVAHVRALVPGAIVIQANSLDYLSGDGYVPDSEKFDFVFLDSHLPIRAKELELLIDGELLSPDAMVAIHDTSCLRPQPDSGAFWTDWNRIQEKYDHRLHVIEFPLSRGLLLIQP